MINRNQECDIVSDLLPLYIEQGIGQESSDFIREHLTGCEECRKNLEYMEISYEDLFRQNKVKPRKRAPRGFGKAKGIIFVGGYLFCLLCVWLYIIFGLWPGDLF